MLITPNPAAPEGKAIIDLAATMDALEARTGEWPGADTVDILGDWLSRFTFATSPALTRQVTGRAWVLRRWDRHSDEVTLWSDEASALAELAQHARSSWDNVADTDGVPRRPPVDDQTAIDLYHGPKEHRGDEDYALYAEDIARYSQTPPSLSPADDTACAQANSAAVFHPMTGPDDEGLPCIELAGILVFAHLDPDLGAVRVSVHLDTADEQLARVDGTIPLHVEVENTTVFSTLGARPAPARVPAWKARLRRLADRTALHAAGAQRRGD
ncbi:hypothetical protein GCM10010261_61900 [Streptomyces pilosus]|uniref:hypothetical protein n=1 Tax=Streptomyces pilosus TaxID=28893 RepID=UPI00167B1B97|nr:hypothetical protein [Streptomyces pilosus]GGV68288.1 hypothetical protein GCM10010261_61900 [Streptomyces pilosus]